MYINSTQWSQSNIFKMAEQMERAYTENWDRLEEFGYFTADEILTLEDTISLLEMDKNENFGIKVFDTLFLLSPEQKAYFSTSSEGEVFQEQVQTHGLHFTKLLAKLIRKLARGNYIEYRKIILELGNCHAGLKIDIIGFQHLHTVLFMTLEDIMGNRFTLLTQRAWLKLFDELFGALVEVEWERQKGVVRTVEL